MTTAKENLLQALTAAFSPDHADSTPAEGAQATAAVLCAFAELIAPPAIALETASELAADETPGLILTELRKQTTLLEVIAKQGEQARRDRSDLIGKWPLFLTPAEVAAGVCADLGADTGGLPG